MIWLAFDIGTTSTKAALIDGNNGGVLAHTHVPYSPEATRTAPGGISEQDPRAWWKASVAAAKQLDCSQVEAIALTGQMQNLILVGNEGEPVRPAILYNDTRAQAEIAAIRQQWGEDKLREITGNEQDASSLLAKMAWVERNQPDGLQKVVLTGAADYIAYQMSFSNSGFSDTTTLSTTGLLHLERNTTWDFDPFTISLEDFVSFETGLPIQGGTKVSEIMERAAEQLGVRTGVPVHLGPGDAGASTIGVGSGESGVPYAYVGTSGWVGFTSDRLYPPETGVFNLAHPQTKVYNPDKLRKYFNVAPLLTAGGNLDFAARLFGSTDYNALTAAALSTTPGKLLYLPYLNGERSPFRDPNARGAFIGLEAGHTPAHLTRAVLEGVAFAYRNALEALMPTFPDALTVTGGAASSVGWMQVFADVLGIQINVAADAEFTGVRGAVIAAKVARGELTTYAPEGWFHTAATYLPTPDRTPHYNAQYARFRAVYPALKDVF